MTIYIVAGFIVAVVGFLFIELGGKRWGRDFTFYSMIAVIGVSLMIPVFFPGTDEGTFYRLAWMLGMCVMVLIGFTRRGLKRSRNSKKD